MPKSRKKKTNAPVKRDYIPVMSEWRCAILSHPLLGMMFLAGWIREPEESK